MSINSRMVRCAAASIVISALWPAAAQAQPSDCQALGMPTHPIAERAETLSWFEQMPERCLKALFKECGDAAGRQILDLGSAAICSIGYEALLKRGFNGDFQALIGWWRRQRDEGAGN
jgi:hypothetical protein